LSRHRLLLLIRCSLLLLIVIQQACNRVGEAARVI
jgi:hypothetical protein